VDLSTGKSGFHGVYSCMIAIEAMAHKNSCFTELKDCDFPITVEHNK
jgi:hypothetical protein